MAIQTVTTANLADYAASRAKPHEISTPEGVTKEVTKGDAPKEATPGNPVITAGEEKLATGPDPGPQPDKEKAKKANPVQPRIDELTREKKEISELLEQEYEQRLRLEGELNALKSREQPKAEEPKNEIGLEPQPETYTDQKLFLKEWGEWQRKTARAEFAAEQAKAKALDDARAAQVAMQSKVARATADFPDFQDVVDRADRTRTAVPQHIIAAFYESDWGAHLAYHLAADPSEAKRIFGLPVAKALLELGKIEDTFVRKAKPADTTTQVVPPPETKQPPAPIARLGESAGVVTVDLSQPMAFKDYLKHRTEEIRAKRRR